MGSWLHLRLVDERSALNIAPALNDLLRGRPRGDLAMLAERGLAALAMHPTENEPIVGSTRARLEAIARRSSTRRSNRSDLNAVSALIESLVYVDTMRPWRPAHEDDVAPLSSLILCDGTDGQLFAELSNRVPIFESLSNQGSRPLLDLRGLDDETLMEASELAVSLTLRDDLARLDVALTKLATDPTFLVELTWDRVEPTYARPTFSRLRRLIRRALDAPTWTLGWSWSP